jgi:hypothetical protein
VAKIIRTYIAFMNLVTPKTGATHEHLVQQTGLRILTYSKDFSNFDALINDVIVVHGKQHAAVVSDNMQQWSA